MGHIYDLCKGKNICEGGDEMDKKGEAEDYVVSSKRRTDYKKGGKPEKKDQLHSCKCVHC